MNKRLIHPDLMSSLTYVLDQTCSIQSFANDAGTIGETEDKTWSDVTTDISCKIARFTHGKNEIRREDKTVVLHPYSIVLDGIYSITEGNRIASEGSYYNILSVDYDSHNTFTSLVCERVKW